MEAVPLRAAPNNTPSICVGSRRGLELDIDVQVLLKFVESMLTVLRLNRLMVGESVAQPSSHQSQAGDQTFTALRVTEVTGVMRVSRSSRSHLLTQ